MLLNSSSNYRMRLSYREHISPDSYIDYNVPVLMHNFWNAVNDMRPILNSSIHRFESDINNINSCTKVSINAMTQ